MVVNAAGSEVVRKTKSQWMLKITEYAQRLIDDLDLVDYPERVKAHSKETGLAVPHGCTSQICYHSRRHSRDLYHSSGYDVWRYIWLSLRSIP